MSYDCSTTIRVVLRARQKEAREERESKGSSWDTDGAQGYPTLPLTSCGALGKSLPSMNLCFLICRWGSRYLLGMAAIEIKHYKLQKLTSTGHLANSSY